MAGSASRLSGADSQNYTRQCYRLKLGCELIAEHIVQGIVVDLNHGLEVVNEEGQTAPAQGRRQPEGQFESG